MVKIKKQRTQKTVPQKKNLKFEDIKNCLEAAQIENKINHLEKNKINGDILKDDQKEFIKNKSILKI